MSSKRRPVDAAILGWPMKVLFSLACAAAILAAPASAADLFGSAPPPAMPTGQSPMFEVGSNWYVRGDLGVSFDRAPSVSFSSLASPALNALGGPLTVGNGANWTTTNFTGGAGFGYRWNDWLRFDATWDYRNGPGGSRQAAVVCPYAANAVIGPAGVPLGILYDRTNTCNASATVSQSDNAFLANAYLDLGTYYGFTPYIGGGLGINMNTLTGSVNYNETANGQPYTANLTAIPPIPPVWVNTQGQALAPQPNIAFGPQFWNRSIRTTTYSMAWALGAGIAYKITPSLTLDVGYRYLNSGTVNSLINPQTGATVRQTNASQQIRVGFIYYIQ
jgi:opacity protein-like surface antigen